MEDTQKVQLLMEQLKKADEGCKFCKHHTETPPCADQYPDFICDGCTFDCICKNCVDNSNWEWCGEVR